MASSRSNQPVSPDLLLIFLGGIFFLRLIIWQFFSGSEAFFREGFSDAAVSVLISALALPWALGKIIARQPFKRSGLELPLLLLMGAAFCSLFYTADRSASLPAVFVLASGMTVFYILFDLLDSPVRLRWALFFLLGLAFIAAVFGIKTFLDYLTHPHSAQDAELQVTNNNLYYLLVHPRAISFFGWPNALAGFLLLFLPLSLVLPFELQKRWQKGVSVVLLPVLAACFLCTFSFLGWVSFLLSGIIVFPFFQKKFKVKVWPVLFVFLALFLIVVVRKDFLAALSPRIFYYKAAFTLLAKSPLWGWGWNTFGLISSSLTNDKRILSAYVHNSYVQALVETGVIGFAGIVLLAVFVFRKVKAAVYDNEQESGHLITVAVAWGVTAFLIDNMFNFTMLQGNVAFFWWAMLGVFCAMLRKGTDEGIKENGKIVTGVVFFTGLLIVFAVLARIAGGYTLYYQAKKNIHNNDPLSMLGSNGNAIKTLTRAKDIDPWSAYLPAAIGESRMNLYALTHFNSLLVMAQKDYAQAVLRSPKYYYNYFVIAKIYGQLGDKVNEEIFTKKARDLSPGEFALDNEMFNKSAGPASR